MEGGAFFFLFSFWRICIHAYKRAAALLTKYICVLSRGCPVGYLPKRSTIYPYITERRMTHTIISWQ